AGSWPALAIQAPFTTSKRAAAGWPPDSPRNMRFSTDPLSHHLDGKAVGKRRALVSGVGATQVPATGEYRMGGLLAGWHGPFVGIMAGMAQAGRRPMFDMRRREFITLLGGASAWPLAARAQQAAMPVVGFLRDATAAGSEFMVNGLRKGLAEAGFVEGHNLTIDYAWSEGQSVRLSTLAAELVGRNVSVIVSSAINATFAAKAATSTIPVVFAVNIDPVASRLAASVNRPGGNLTGVSYLTSELGAKRLGLMHEMVPRVTDFAVLAHPTYPASARFISDVEAAARSLGFRIEVFNASTES